MSELSGLIVGNSRVDRSVLESLLQPLVELSIVGSFRGGQRAVEKFRTRKIDVLFLHITSEEDYEKEFLAELCRAIPSTTYVFCVSSLGRLECSRIMSSTRINIGDCFALPATFLESQDMVRCVQQQLRGQIGRGETHLDGNEDDRPEMLCIVASTGGPEALGELLAALPDDFALPILVTQHLPASFVTPFCESLGQHARRPAHVACNGQQIASGQIYVAPGGSHLEVRRRKSRLVCVLSDGPPSAGCKPSGNKMLASAARATRGHLIAVCLTGMGEDGSEGMQVVRECGGRVIVQDEQSSVVWGMPGAIVRSGSAHHVLPLSEISEQIVRLTTKGAKPHVSRSRAV